VHGHDTDFLEKKEREMDSELWRELAQLRKSPVGVLRAKYREVFGEEPRSKHRNQLFRRIAWRMQAVACTGLSEMARQRAHEIGNIADIRLLPPRHFDVAAEPVALVGRGKSRFDRRIPPVGTVLQREYNGASIAVKVLADGFEHQGRRYGSLSAIATQITGTRWNGLAFFGLAGRRRAAKGKSHV
jgi:hypothetical protein